MISVNNVSFGAKYAKTENGNYYKKKNTGKSIGTMAGIAGGIGLATIPAIQMRAFRAGFSMFPKNPIKAISAGCGIIVAGIALFALIGRALGNIPDRMVNKKRMAKADAK